MSELKMKYRQKNKDEIVVYGVQNIKIWLAAKSFGAVKHYR